VNIGAYVAGSDPLLDEALERREAIRGFLTQDVGEHAHFDETMQQLRTLAGEA